MDLTDKSRRPTMEELAQFIENPLFDALYEHLAAAYGAQSEILYSGDRQLLGWNVRFYKSGRTLCRLYPRHGFFTVLVVVGRKEKVRVEALLPGMTETMQALYAQTREGMGQRWLLIDLHTADAVYSDILTLIAIRRESK